MVGQLNTLLNMNSKLFVFEVNHQNQILFLKTINFTDL